MSCSTRRILWLGFYLSMVIMFLGCFVAEKRYRLALPKLRLEQRKPGNATEYLFKLTAKGRRVNRNKNKRSKIKRVTSRASIDLDKEVPPLDELYERLILVTSFSSNHFNEGLGFIGSAQNQMPNKPIVVYDIGLDAQQKMVLQSLCNVDVREFHFKKYPSHMEKLNTYAFKPTIINLVLNEFGVIYYGDSSIRFNDSLVGLLPDAVKHHGFLGNIRCFDPKTPTKARLGCHHDYYLTREEMFQKIGVNRTELFQSIYSAPSVSGGLLLLVNSTTIQTKIMKPWLQCALDQSCIAPQGASKNNHRFDQSALTLLLYKNMWREWTLDNDRSFHHMNVVSVQRGTDGHYWKPVRCK